MATTSILSNTQSMKRRRRHPIMDAHKMIPATVWIFILLFVIVVFLALLPATPTGTTTTTTSTTTSVAGVKETTTNHNNNKNNNNKNNNKNHHKSAVEKLHDATSGLGRTLRKVVQTKREEFQHALAGLTTHDTTAGGIGIGGGNVMPHRLKALRDKHEIIGEQLMEIQQGRETAEELLHRGGRSSQTFSLQDKQAHIHDLVQAKLLQKKKREKKKLKKINHKNNNKDGDKDEENGSNVVAKDPEQQIQEKLSKKQKLKQKIQKKMEQKFELLQLQQEEEEGNLSDKPPMKMNEIITYLSNWIHYLHENLKMRQIQHSTLYELIWKTYHDITIQTLYPWDQEYIQRMPERRDDDDSIFLSLISYRDEHCFHTLYDAYAKAKHPELLFVGLIQQVCREDCRRSSTTTASTTSSTTTTVEEVPPDDDCFQLFCDSDLGQKYCNNDEGNHHVRVLDIKDSESLGPYMTKFMASKLWEGENWYMHLDLYNNNNNNNNNNIMTFVKHWDSLSIKMLEKAPSKRPIISHSPSTLSSKQQQLCGSVFAKSDLENQIIQLEEEEDDDGGSSGSGSSSKKKEDGEEEQQEEYPLFASFIASGYFITNSRFLQEVPFDPFLPWIFMGEEILMSSRLWTAGYDIFTPTQSIVYYDERRRRTHGGGHGHQKSNLLLLLLFWESIHRIFTRNVHNSFQMFLLDRIKYQLGYPEASEDLLPDRTLLTAVESYTMGSRRSLHWYLKLIGLNMTTKEISNTYWCEGGFPPPGFEQYNDLYSNGVVKKNETVIQWMEEVLGSEDDETTSGAMTDDTDDLEDDDEAVEDVNTDHGDADAKEEEEEVVEQAEDDNDDDDNGVDETASEEDDDKTK